MQSEVQVILDDQTLAAAVVTLAEGHIHRFPVADRPNKLGC
jgi:CBS domain-containing protein